jgi:hypothetical protein
MTTADIVFGSLDNMTEIQPVGKRIKPQDVGETDHRSRTSRPARGIPM